MGMKRCFPCSYFFITKNRFTVILLMRITPSTQKEQQLEDLKEEVRKELMAVAADTKKQLKFIDEVQRLGVAYHFEKEIEEALQNTYDNNQYPTGDINHDLYYLALRFRLLRQQGFNISCGKSHEYEIDFMNII